MRMQLGHSWSTAKKMMPACHWVVNGSIHCDWGAQQLAYDASTDTVFFAVGNSTGGLGKGHGCDDGDGNEENGSWIRTSTDKGESWDTPTKVAPPASPTHCATPVMGNGMQIRPGTPHAGRVLFTTTHNSFHGCIVVHTDDGGKTYNYSHSSNLIRLGIDETQIAQLPNGSLMAISRNCIGINNTIGPQCPTGPPPPKRLPTVKSQGTSVETTARAILGDNDDPRQAPRKAGDRFTWSVSVDGGDTWSQPRQHPDLVTPGCKGSLISYKDAVYFSGPYSVVSKSALSALCFSCLLVPSCICTRTNNARRAWCA